MARRFTFEILKNLATAIGANPSKWTGTRTNVTFLGKGLPRNPLFQEPLAGIETATESQLGSRGAMIEAVEDAMGFYSAGKLNTIQTEILGKNLSAIKNIYKPPVLPSAEVTAIAPGIEGLRRFPKESHKFFGRPLKDQDFAAIDKLVQEGKLKGVKVPEGVNPRDTILPEALFPGSSSIQAGQRTSARAAMIKLLDMTPRGEPGVGPTLRELLSKQQIKWILEGGGGTKGDPLLIFKDIFGVDVAKHLPLDASPQTINAFTRKLMRMKDRGGNWFDEVGFNPEEPVFAEGGLADILQVRSGYSKGRAVKGALAILNRNKKNAEYMFKASDNVSPGYAHGDLKYNAELLADQLAEDAGVVFADLDSISQTKFYGTAYDYLAAEMGKHLLQKRMLKDVGQKMILSDFNVKGRKPNASGGLAKILEV